MIDPVRPDSVCRRRAPIALAVAAIIGLTALFPAATARADDYVSQANAMYLVMRKDNRTEVPVPQDKRSELVLLPAVASMTPPPAFLKNPNIAILMTPDSRDWAAAVAWAKAAPQRAVLEALTKITEDEGAETHMVFAQPYGVENVPVEMVSADLYTELGSPPLLAAADFRYLNKMEWVVSLAHLEANRLAAEGKPAEAIEVAMDLLFFGGQLAGRQLFKEKVFGLAVVGSALEAIRDIAYRDFRSKTHILPIDKLKDIVSRLAERKTPQGVERLLLPAADRLAMAQLIEAIYDPQTGQPDPDRFGTTLAHISTSSRPLRLFADAAKWEQVRPVAAKLADVKDVLRKVADDAVYRWGLGAFDPSLATDNDYKKLVAGKAPMQVLTLIYESYPLLFQVRQDLRTEAAGTRTSLAMYGYFLQNNTFPKVLSAIRPTFVQAIDKDPYSPQGREIEFFVPMRDTPKGTGAAANLYEMRVFPGGEYKPFSAKLDDTEFVIYSVGQDNDKGWAKDVVGNSRVMKSGDYGIWPPVTSLLRNYLVQEGKLP